MLIIIDMQPIFEASNFVLRPVCDYIKKAKKNKDRIVLVEYRCWDCIYGKPEDCLGDCESHSDITNLLRKYKKTIHVYKNSVSGADEIIKEVKDFPKEIDVCGVNTTACVKETVQELIWLRPELKCNLLADACNDSLHGQKRFSYYWTKSFKQNIFTNFCQPPLSRERPKKSGPLRLTLQFFLQCFHGLVLHLPEFVHR